MATVPQGKRYGVNLDNLHARLVDRLDTTNTIRAAFTDHPRHRFIPDLVWPSARGLPLYRTANLARWAAYVYDDDAVVIQANDGGSGSSNIATSSSLAPQLMADMIAAARVEPGMRVLEIGTGTGWNAAILASLVGPTGHVTSLEIDPDVAAHARSRLSGTGVRVITGTTAPDADAYDSVIATCAVRHVPESWPASLTPPGVAVLPWAPYDYDGPTPVVALSHTLQGDFLCDASIMRDRTQRLPRDTFAGTAQEMEQVGGFPVGSRELVDRGLLTRLTLATPGLRVEEGRRPWDGDSAPVIALSTADSWVHLWPDGTTTGAGPRDLGKELGEAYVELDAAGWPELTEFTLEVSPDRRTHTIRAGALGPWEHSLR